MLQETEQFLRFVPGKRLAMSSATQAEVVTSLSKSNCLVGIGTFQLANEWISRIRNIYKIQHSKSLTAGANLLAERARDPHDLEMDRCSMYSHFDCSSMRMWRCFIPFHISLRTRTWPWMYNGTRNSRQFFGGFRKAMDIRWVVGSLH